MHRECRQEKIRKEQTNEEIIQHGGCLTLNVGEPKTETTEGNYMLRANSGLPSRKSSSLLCMLLIYLCTKYLATATLVRPGRLDWLAGRRMTCLIIGRRSVTPPNISNISHREQHYPSPLQQRCVPAYTRTVLYTAQKLSF